jgi:hypothetical protein
LRPIPENHDEHEEDMSDIESIKSQFRANFGDMKARIKEIQDAAKAESQGALQAAFDDFFASNPGVYGIGWTQYTPHWCDGEACEFGKNETCLFFDEESFEEDGFGGNESDLLKSREYYAGRGRSPSEVSKIDGRIEELGGVDAVRKVTSDFKRLDDFLGEIGDEYMEMIYGDGYSVLYTKDGLKVEEYDHD